MRSPGINEGELRGKPANPGSPEKKSVKTECVCVCTIRIRLRFDVERLSNGRRIEVERYGCKPFHNVSLRAKVAVRYSVHANTIAGSLGLPTAWASALIAFTVAVAQWLREQR